MFQINVSYPATGCQKLIEVDDELKMRAFYEKRMAQEMSAESLGDEWKVKKINFLKLKGSFPSSQQAGLGPIRVLHRVKFCLGANLFLRGYTNLALSSNCGRI